MRSRPDRSKGRGDPGKSSASCTAVRPPNGTTLDGDALPPVIQGIEAKGYHFVTLHAFLKDGGHRRRRVHRTGTCRPRELNREHKRIARSQTSRGPGESAGVRRGAFLVAASV